MVQDILIATSEHVSDHAHLEAAYQFDMIMQSINPEVARRIRDRKVLCILIGHDELTSDVPQFTIGQDRRGTRLLQLAAARVPDLAWTVGRRSSSPRKTCSNTKAACSLESILIHEFGHVIHGAGFDEALKKRLQAAYEQRESQGPLERRPCRPAVSSRQERNAGQPARRAGRGLSRISRPGCW